MKKWPNISAVFVFFVALLISQSSLFAASSLSGTIKDAQTGEELYGANIIIEGTAFGAASDINGKYIIRNIPEGTYTLTVSYIGFQPQSATIEVVNGKNLEQNFRLVSESFESDEVIVSAQALGQIAAINQQLSSTQISNVVSEARIQELPDANAAESVGRLPGVSLLRSGGEGEKIVVRGLEPKFNSITINGVKLASSGSDDRGIDLSMISSNMLAGIQVMKTVTADQDANVIGGSVNFELRKAETEEPGVPDFGFLAQGGVNGLDNAKDRFKNYKFVGTVENRMMNNKLGLFVQGSYENRNLSSNELGAEYSAQGNSDVNYLISNLSLDDIIRERKRGNGVVSVDYQLPAGSIQLMNLFSTSSTESFDRQQAYYISGGENAQRFNALYGKSTLNTISNILEFRHELSIFNTKLSLAHTYSETKNPKDWEVDFVSTPAGLKDYTTIANVDPREVALSALNDSSNTLLETVSTTYSFARERSLIASMDFDTQVNFTDKITAVFKFGGSYQHTKRSYDYNIINGEKFGYSSGGEVVNQLDDNISWFSHVNGDPLNVPFDQFIYGDFDFGTFMDGDYQMYYPLNFDRLQEMVDFMYANQLEDNITYNYNIGESILNDYNGKEDVSAAYLMATVDIGQSLTIIPGIRYQQLRTEYTAAQGLQGPNAPSVYAHEMKTVTKYYPYWLPSISVNYKPLSWFGLRMAYTNTLSYPDFNAMAPKINVYTSSGVLQYNGFNLKPIESENYDVNVSFYNNTIGLFTVDGFLKKISNLIYEYRFYPTSAELVQYYPDWVENKNPISGVKVTTYINNPYTVDDYGVELDWQTTFWYLPQPLNGLVLNVNYTHIFSEAEYPYVYVNSSTRPTTYIDTSYFAPLISQPDDIVNVTLGYDYKDFSMRVSCLYSSKIFTGPNQWPQLRASTESYTRWDISMKQKLRMIYDGLEVFCNMNNIGGADDVSVISASTGVPSRHENYDSVIEAGIRCQF